MSVKELLSILDTIPYGILTYDNTDYQFLFRAQYIEILFKYDNITMCSLTVYKDRDMNSFTYTHSNDMQLAYDKCIPKCVPSPSNFSKCGVSAGVEIIKISFIPASIRVLNG